MPSCTFHNCKHENLLCPYCCQEKDELHRLRAENTLKTELLRQAYEMVSFIHRECGGTFGMRLYPEFNARDWLVKALEALKSPSGESLPPPAPSATGSGT